MPTSASRVSTLRRRYFVTSQIGLALSLAIVVGLFSAAWGTAERATAPPPPDIEPAEIVEAIPTDHRQRLAPPPPPSPLPPQVEEIELPDWPEEPLWEPPSIDDFPTGLPTLAIGPTVTGPPDTGAEVFERVEIMPEPVGGLAAIQQRVEYPTMARRVGIQGTVIVQFVVDSTGQTSEFECLRDLGGGTCEAAIEAIRATEFTPGFQRDRAVSVRFRLPVRFQLR